MHTLNTNLLTISIFVDQNVSVGWQSLFDLLILFFKLIIEQILSVILEICCRNMSSRSSCTWSSSFITMSTLVMFSGSYARLYLNLGREGFRLVSELDATLRHFQRKMHCFLEERLESRSDTLKPWISFGHLEYWRKLCMKEILFQLLSSSIMILCTFELIQRPLFIVVERIGYWARALHNLGSRTDVMQFH